MKETKRGPWQIQEYKNSRSFHAEIKVKQATKTTQHKEHTELLTGTNIFQMFQEFSDANLTFKYHLCVGQNYVTQWFKGLVEIGKWLQKRRISLLLEHFQTIPSYLYCENATDKKSSQAVVAIFSARKKTNSQIFHNKLAHSEDTDELIHKT